MSAPPLSHDLMREALALSAEHGNAAAAARAIGIPAETMRSRIRRAKDAAARGEFGLAPVIPGFEISRVTNTPKGDFVQQRPAHGDEFQIPEGHLVKGVSALLDADGREVLKWVKTKQGELSTEAIIESLKDAFSSTPAAKLPAAPKRTDADTLTVYSIVDWHVGLLAWAEETGQNYDLKIAQKVIMDAMGRLIAASPPSKQCIVLGLGDLLHFDGYEHITSKSGNFLDGDGRYPKVLRTAARMVIETIDMALQRHDQVLVRMLPGNHDTRSTVAINLALGMRYEASKRVTVDDSAAYMWWYRFGKNFFGATHGDKARMKDLPLVMAADRPQDWAASTNRRIFTGHLHNERRIEEGGVVVTCMRTPVAKDAYHSFERFRSGRSVYSETYRADGSEAATLAFNL
jgi:hypothetical protein